MIFLVLEIKNTPNGVFFPGKNVFKFAKLWKWVLKNTGSRCCECEVLCSVDQKLSVRWHPLQYFQGNVQKSVFSLRITEKSVFLSVFPSVFSNPENFDKIPILKCSPIFHFFLPKNVFFSKNIIHTVMPYRKSDCACRITPSTLTFPWLSSFI